MKHRCQQTYQFRSPSYRHVEVNVWVDDVRRYWAAWYDGGRIWLGTANRCVQEYCYYDNNGTEAIGFVIVGRLTGDAKLLQLRLAELKHDPYAFFHAHATLTDLRPLRQAVVKKPPRLVATLSDGVFLVEFEKRKYQVWLEAGQVMVKTEFPDGDGTAVSLPAALVPGTMTSKAARDIVQYLYAAAEAA